ncbi:MBL fold metallo-hydrolase [Bartonella sp. DGB1]|uniref:MBL fold metallo-hydrolase n=1 Tax=Bartonella sp. DGB1 TaxID=3239807 RepID=UPI0035267B03
MIKDKLKITILGCGSSMGVPRPNGVWGECDPNNKFNRRTRCSLLVQRINKSGEQTNVVIDTGPDLRSQLITAQVKSLDAVLYTHMHADHIHGIDDLRVFALNKRKVNEKLYVYGHKATIASLKRSFRYCFHSQDEHFYPSLLTAIEITAKDQIIISGAGGDLIFDPVLQLHGSIYSFGFKFNNIGYSIDLNDFASITKDKFKNLNLLIIEALQIEPHISHLSLDDALNWIKYFNPHNAILTAMSNNLDYNKINNKLPGNVKLAHDGLTLELCID